MKLSVLTLLAAGLAGAMAHGQQPTPPPTVRSPEILADNRVTFRLAAPAAREVRLTCECLPEARPLTKDDQGVWSVTIGPVEPEIYEYEFWLDGVAIHDPRNEAVKYNSRPSLVSSLLEVRPARPAFYDPRPVPHGTVAMRYYQSKTTGSVRRLHVYTPPGYERGTARLPVLYLLHGGDGDDSVWTAFGRANHILDNLMAEGRLSPMVVVMPFGYAYPPAAGAATEQQRAAFERDLLDDILPFVEANYRVGTGRDQRALAGLSMGGGQTLAIGLRHLDRFSRLAGFSAGVPRSAPAEAYGGVMADATRINESLKLFWLGCGSEDGLMTPNREFSAFLKSRGIRHTFRETSGAHTWIVWRQYLREVAPQLFPQS